MRVVDGVMAAALIADLAVGPKFLASSTAPSAPPAARPPLQIHATSVDGLQVRSAHFPLRSIPFAKRWPYFRDYRGDPAARTPQGVPLHRAADGKLYPHPVAAAQYGMHQVTVGHRAKALAAGNNLLDQAVRGDGGALWLPYRFPFALYGDPAKTLTPPWYSAMAQGEALSLFTALAEKTGDARWKRAADEVFASFQTNTYDIVQRDSNGYLWLEEYPHNGTGERVFNGHMFALLGLVDYYDATGRGAKLIDAALTTTRRYAAAIRNRGQISSYSLGDPADQNATYHHVHIVLLRSLFRLTGDRYFHRAADEFQSDARVELPRGV
jgi:hypothetical protein